MPEDLNLPDVKEPLDAQKPIVIVDIDGVLFDTPVDAVEAANQANGTNYHVTDIFNHNAEHDKEKFVVNGEDQFWKFQHDTDKYRKVEGARKALERLAKRATIIALTSRNYDDFEVPTRRAIEEHFGDLISKVLFTTEPSNAQHREKGEIVVELGGKLLLDDAVKYCESAVAHGVPAILIPQPYNESGHNYPPELRATDWEHAADMVEAELDRSQTQ